jgi:hypothetical protein
MRSLTKEIEEKGRELPLGSRGKRNHQNPFGSGRISGGNEGEKKGAAPAPWSSLSSVSARGRVECGVGLTAGSGGVQPISRFDATGRSVKPQYTTPRTMTLTANKLGPLSHVSLSTKPLTAASCFLHDAGDRGVVFPGLELLRAALKKIIL